MSLSHTPLSIILLYCPSTTIVPRSSYVLFSKEIHAEVLVFFFVLRCPLIIILPHQHSPSPAYPCRSTIPHEQTLFTISASRFFLSLTLLSTTDSVTLILPHQQTLSSTLLHQISSPFTQLRGSPELTTPLTAPLLHQHTLHPRHVFLPNSLPHPVPSPSPSALRRLGR